MRTGCPEFEARARRRIPPTPARGGGSDARCAYAPLLLVAALAVAGEGGAHRRTRAAAAAAARAANGGGRPNSTTPAADVTRMWTHLAAGDVWGSGEGPLVPSPPCSLLCAGALRTPLRRPLMAPAVRRWAHSPTTSTTNASRCGSHRHAVQRREKNSAGLGSVPLRGAARGVTADGGVGGRAGSGAAGALVTTARSPSGGVTTAGIPTSGGHPAGGARTLSVLVAAPDAQWHGLVRLVATQEER